MFYYGNIPYQFILYCLCIGASTIASMEQRRIIFSITVDIHISFVRECVIFGTPLLIFNNYLYYFGEE